MEIKKNLAQNLLFLWIPSLRCVRGTMCVCVFARVSTIFFHRWFRCTLHFFIRSVGFFLLHRWVWQLIRIMRNKRGRAKKNMQTSGNNNHSNPNQTDQLDFSMRTRSIWHFTIIWWYSQTVLFCYCCWLLAAATDKQQPNEWRRRNKKNCEQTTREQ